MRLNRSVILSVLEVALSVLPLTENLDQLSLNFTIVEILYLFAAFHGVFLASLLMLKKGSNNNRYLVLLILFFSFYLTENVIYSSGYIKQLPHLYFVTLPIIFLIGPLFYTYVRAALRSDFKLKPKDLLHLLPFIFEVIILIPFYRLSGDIKIRVYEMSLESTSSWEFSIFFVGYLIYLGGTFWYFFASYKLLRNHPDPSGAKERKKIDWLKKASFSFFSYMFLSLILSILIRPFPEITPTYFHLNLISLTILIHAIGYVAFISPDLFNGSQISNYQFSSIGADKMRELISRLNEVVTANQPHLQSDVSAEDIGKMLGISKHQLSQLLNVGLNTNFYDFINHRRIEHSKKILLSEEYREAKILHVAFDSGFSNKASFLRNFKKLTGLTPTNYRNLQENQVSFN
ncbi:MAG: helix-turn-helix domain-containing protein [Cyclobacteriaceae bacterium]